jgi:hypothetical protein
MDFIHYYTKFNVERQYFSPFPAKRDQRWNFCFIMPCSGGSFSILLSGKYRTTCTAQNHPSTTAIAPRRA